MTLHDLAKMKIADADKRLISLFAMCAGITLEDAALEAMRQHPSLTVSEAIRQMSPLQCKGENVTVCNTGVHTHEEVVV